MNDIIFNVVSPMDRIKGAQQHFGQGLTTGKMVIIGIVVVVVIAFVIFGILKAVKK